MEQAIGYQDLFPDDEWDAIDFGSWDSDEYDDVAPDGELDDAPHAVTVYEVPGNGFEIECERCGEVGASRDRTEAKAIARLHTAFVAVLVDRWCRDDV